MTDAVFHDVLRYICVLMACLSRTDAAFEKFSIDNNADVNAIPEGQARVLAGPYTA